MAQGGTKRTSLRRATLTRASILIKNEEDNSAETDDQKRKRQFDYMTSDVLKARQKHLLAGQYFASLGNTVFVVSALITLFQAGLATVAQAKTVSEIFSLKSTSQLHYYLPFPFSGSLLQSTGTLAAGLGYSWVTSICIQGTGENLQHCEFEG